MKILVIGDPHIPRRASEVPPIVYDKLNQLTSSQLYEYTFFTGDLIKAPNFIQFLNVHTKRDLFIVVGNMDYYGGNRNAPVSQNLSLSVENNETLNIGLIHGHQISPRGDHSQLELLALENNYNILISGHTHKEEVYLTDKGVLLLNPGSITGAWSFISSGKPSFIILNLDEIKKEVSTILYTYDSREQRVKESKSYYLFIDNRIKNKY